MANAFEVRELMEQFVEGLSGAIEAVRPSEHLVLHASTREFRDGMKKASVTATGLAHAQANPIWLTIRDMLEKLDIFFVVIAQKRPLNIKERKMLVNVLETALQKSRQMVTAKALGRQEVIATLDRRVDLEKQRQEAEKIHSTVH